MPRAALRRHFPPVRRRRFDRLVIELSVELGEAVPRFPLWIFVHEQGLDPERLGRDELLGLCDGPLQRFLADRGRALPPRAERRLARRLARFDPRHPAPEEIFARL